jgi:hypothetical protein
MATRALVPKHRRRERRPQARSPTRPFEAAAEAPWMRAPTLFAAKHVEKFRNRKRTAKVSLNF